jgi:hypothetical protein
VGGSSFNAWCACAAVVKDVGSIIMDDDIEALKFLQDIRVELLHGETEGFRLLFDFSENPYFTNVTLTKEYHCSGFFRGDTELDNVEGCVCSPPRRVRGSPRCQLGFSRARVGCAAARLSGRRARISPRRRSRRKTSAVRPGMVVLLSRARCCD